MGQYGDVRTRETGSMISASAFSYTVLCGMMVLTYVKELPRIISSVVSRAGLQLYFFYAILLSGSRGPIILAILIMGVMFFGKQSVSKYRAINVMVLFVILVACAYWSFDEVIKLSVIDRSVNEGSGGRYEKLLLVFSMISQGTYSLTGVPDYIQQISEINNVSFSDNSFGTLLLVFGISALVPIFVIFYMALSFSRITHTILPVMVGLVCLSTTNSILWEPWIFYYLVAMALIFFSNIRHFNVQSDGRYVSNAMCLN